MQMMNDSIIRFTIPYKDIFTTIYIVRTDKGVLIFDAATFDSDTEEYIKPALEKAGVSAEEVKYIFISHNHRDHAGGLSGFMKHFEKCTIISRSDELCEKFSQYSVCNPADGEVFMDCLRVVAIPGHTVDSSGILDIRSNTLISGDSLQLHGIMGSGNWAANIRLTGEHINAVERLRNMEIDRILTAHDYVPFGYDYDKDTVPKALDSCIEPLIRIKDLITANPDMTDEEITAIYNNPDIPKLGSHVVTAARKYFSES